MLKIKAPSKVSVNNKERKDADEDDFIAGWAYVVVEGQSNGKWVKFTQTQSGEIISFQEIIELWKRKRKQKDRRRRRFLKKQKERMERAKREQVDRLSA
jgi:hypothetical protein